VVGLAVAGVAPESDDDPTVGEAERDPLELEGGAGSRGVDRLVEQHVAGVEIQTDQTVDRVVGGGDGGHHEDLGPARIDDRGTGDPHCRLDVAAQSRHVRGGERGAEVLGPEHRPRVGGQGVDGVVLGGGEHPAAGHQRLAVELAVEGGGGPRRRGMGEGVARGVDTGALAVVVEGGPVGGHHGRRAGADSRSRRGRRRRR
jgi:hypothetical protein